MNAAMRFDFARLRAASGPTRRRTPRPPEPPELAAARARYAATRRALEEAHHGESKAHLAALRACGRGLVVERRRTRRW